MISPSPLAEIYVMYRGSSRISLVLQLYLSDTWQIRSPEVQETVETNDFFFHFYFQLSTYMHHVTSIVKDRHLAVVLHLGVGAGSLVILMCPGLQQYDAQSCQELKANCGKITNKLISWSLFYNNVHRSKWCPVASEWFQHISRLCCRCCSCGIWSYDILEAVESESENMKNMTPSLLSSFSVHCADDKNIIIRWCWWRTSRNFGML